jgi:signal transduction histidine kinase
VHIDISEDEFNVIIDVTDSGKGIPKSRQKTIFNPGYTSKQRGWGLGLTLSRRIIKNYHSGKIFVRSSVLNKGTTFRIMLKKKL